MARPCKSALTLSDYSQTKEEIAERVAIEKALRSGDNKLKPPKYLSKEQKKIFLYIMEELRASGILGNLDVFVLSQCAIAIDRLQYIETAINDNITLLCNAKFMASKEKYSKNFYRCCNELSLSPQARAKIGNINLQGAKTRADPVLTLLAGVKQRK